MTVGIDFGTSTSEIAYVGDDGKPVLIPNHLDEFITPSIVYINEDGSALVGREAKEKAFLEPENTFIEVKRLLDSKTTLSARGREYSPVTIASMIIKYLVECAEKFTGDNIDSAVITVPAYFNDNQRKEVISAGEMAGLNIKRIINEPTAASLDYGIEHMRECSFMLIYDLGGGTLDVTVLEMFEGVVDVKASCGNNTMGGKDFDQALVDHIVNRIINKDGINISNDPRAMIRVKMAAEQCKISLSSELEYAFELPFLYRVKDQPAGFSEIITRNDFENMIHDKLYITSQQIKTALFDAELTPEDIDLTLMVGGSTRIPLVQKFLEESFGFKPQALVDPDLAVVRGASIQAGVLSGVIDENAIILTDVCPYTLSTDVAHFDLFDRTIHCDPIIRRNTTLPVTASKIYYTCSDNQQSVSVSAYQGESIFPSDNYLLNKFYLSGIPKAKAGKEQIKVTFSYDINGLLVISSEIVSNGKSATVTVDTSAVGKMLDLTAWKKAPAARKYRQIINKADRLLNVYDEELTEALSSALDEFKKSLILEWDADVIATLSNDVQNEIDELEEM